MKTTNKKTIEQAIRDNKALAKKIKEVYNLHENEGIDQFVNDAEQYITAISERRMFCQIIKVSASGMSRVLAYKSCEVSKNEKNKYWYSNYFALFLALGYTRAGDGFRINGCGMDMNFATNYENMHIFKTLGLITGEQCRHLAQQTPTCF